MRRATPVTVIATGGTARTLARMATAKQQQLPTHDQGLILSQSDLNTLVGLSARELRSAKGVDLRRVDTLHPGAILLAEILRGLQQERLITSDRSLRDGLLAAWIAQHRPELTLQDTCPDPRQRSVLRARQRFCPDPTHADHVAHLAGQLFDQLGGLHQASTEDRDLLCLGAVLHDIGHHIAGRGHAKHGMYLLQHTRMYGFVAPTIAQLAVLVRYHSRTMPKLRHPEFAALSPPAQAKIRLLAGILRLADALDRTHNQVVSDIKSVQITDTTVTIFAGAKDSAEIERWAFQQRAPLLAEVLGRSVVLQLLSADHV